MEYGDKMLTTRMVARKLGVSIPTVFRLVEKGLPAYFLGGRLWRFRESEVDRWLEERRVKSKEGES